MRVALYENLPSGGSKREAFEFARALGAHGHVVDLWTTNAADETFLPLQEVTRQQFRYDWPGTRSTPRRLPGLRGYVIAVAEKDRLRRIARTARVMAARIDLAGYDFVFAHHCQPIQGPYLLRFLRTPSFYYCAEPMRQYYDPPIDRPYDHEYVPPVSRLQRRWYAPAQQSMTELRKQDDYLNVRAAGVLLTNSSFSGEAIYRAYNRRALVSYLGVDDDLFRPLGLPRREFVLSVGAVLPHKGYDFLIDALGCLPVEIRPPLVIVGNMVSEPEHTYLQRQAARRAVTLEVRSRVTDAELVRLYNQACAFVYAPVLEPFGFAPLEAMACGTPVVAVAEGGVHESVRDGVTGLLTQRDPRHFAAALTRVLADSALRDQLGAAAVSTVRSFWTWPAAYDRFMTLVCENLDKAL